MAADGSVWGVNSADNIYRRTFQVRKLSRSLEVAVADCPLDNYQFPVLDVSADSGLRDQHGQLTSMQGAFSFRTAAGLTKDYESCQEAERAKYDKPDSDMTLEELTEEYNNCLRDNFYEPIDQSLQLVFGSNPSPGFICGVKDAVKAYTKNDGKALPGYCCLDAPYELGNEHWGYKVR